MRTSNISLNIASAAFAFINNISCQCIYFCPYSIFSITVRQSRYKHAISSIAVAEAVAVLGGIKLFAVNSAYVIKINIQVCFSYSRLINTNKLYHIILIRISNKLIVTIPQCRSNFPIMLASIIGCFTIS